MNKLIHHTAIFYLALIMLVRMVAMPLSLLDYSLNRNFIASTLCENKGRPEVHCSGKCYLNKQLSKASDNQDAKGQKGTAKTGTVDFFEKAISLVFSCEGNLQPAHLFIEASAIPSVYSGNIFHPPIA
jgi:hypothetical protein